MAKSSAIDHARLSRLLVALGGLVGLAMQRHAEALESQDSSSVLNRMRARFDLEGRINAEKELAGESRAKLIISGPHRLKDSKYISQVYWRMRAYNDGPAAAANVQMKLRCGAPGPKDANWSGDYPYPVVPVGFTPDVPSLPINPKDDDNYEIICGWKSDAGIFFTNLDTKSGGHRPIQIGPDERWRLAYEMTASNAPTENFTLDIFIEADEVKVTRES